MAIAPRRGASHRQHCFVVPGRIVPRAAEAPRVALEDRPAAALAALLPLLGCGEEAAALAFDGLADRYGADDHIAQALGSIAHDERVHDALIAGLCRDLPEVAANRNLLAKARRFHVALTRGGTGFHLARIAALDSAVCVLLSRLLRHGWPIAADQYAATVLNRIRRDEARHVHLSRGLALNLRPNLAMRDAAAGARDALANVLALAAEAFETLGVDAATLDRDIRRLPDGLLKV